MITPDTAEFAGTWRFAVQRRLGAGGMGVVYEVHDSERDVRVALKVLNNLDPAALVRFKREFRSLASIVHPNLVELYELFSDDGKWFFTMEAVDGTDFLSWVRPEEPDFDRLRNAMHQLTEGVHAIHAAGRLHCDLKPSNLIVRPDGSVVILDFGLISELGRESSLSDELAGTAAYMAPERWDGAPLTEASDWYAVGVILHEALTGRLPFVGARSEVLGAKLTGDAPAPSSVAANVPDDFDTLCRDLLRRDPASRPGVAEIAGQLGLGRRAPRPVIEARSTENRVPLVGRARHMNMLAAALESVEAGCTMSVHLHGASGTGKSTLMERFLGALEERADTVVLTGRCYEQESVPYKALDSLVDALAEYLCGLAPKEVEPLIPVHAAVLARAFPVLQRVPAIADAPGGGLRIPDQRELRRTAVAALREMLTRIGQRRQLVLAIDDLQWGDTDSAQLLGELLQPPDPPRLLFLLSYRSEYMARSACLTTLVSTELIAEPWRRRIEIRVDPLTEMESQELALSLLASHDAVALASAERLARESGGNPYFIYELARHVGVEERADAGTGGSTTVELDAVLWRRVQRLPDVAREILEIVAVAGQPIELRHVLDTADVKEGVQHAIALLRAEHFVRSSGPSLRDDIETYHDRVRESIVARLDPATVRTHHAGLARSLEVEANADLETVAAHFAGAGEAEKASRYYAQAASAAAAALAFDQAAALNRRALDLRPDAGAGNADLYRALADALANAGRGFEAATAYQSAARYASGDDLFELERLAATQFCISGYLNEGREIFRRLLRGVGLVLPSNPISVLTSLVLRRTRLRLRGVGFKQHPAASVPASDLRRIDLLWSVATGLSVPDALGVASLQTKGLLLALDAGEPYRLARAIGFEAFLTGAGGWPADRRSSELIGKAEALARQIDDPHAIGVVHLMKGLIALTQSRFGDSAQHCMDAEEILRSRCSGVAWEISTARSVLAWTLWHRGQFEELRRRMVGYLAEARDRGDLFLLTNLRSVVEPMLHLLDDEPEIAERDVDEAMLAWRMEGFDLQHVNAMFSRATIGIYRGDGLGALERIDAFWPSLRRALQLQTQLVRINMTDLRARAALAAAGNASDPGPLLARAERDARRVLKERTIMSEPFARGVLAGVAAMRSDRRQAIEQLRLAIPAYDANDDALRAASMRLRLARLVDGAEATALTSAALEVMARENVRNPARLATLFAPGFRD